MDGEPKDALPYEPPRRIALPPAAVGAVIIRLFALKVTADLIGQVPLIASMFVANVPDVRAQWASIALHVAWNAAFAIVLLWLAAPIAARVFGRDEIPAADLGAGSWMVLIVAGVGFAMAAFAATELVTAFAHLYLRAGRLPPREALWASAPLVKLAIGVALFLRPWLLVTPWLRVAAR